MAASTGPASGAGRVWWFYWHKTQPAYQPPALDEPTGDEEPADNGEPPLVSDGTSGIDLSIERVTHAGDDITTLLLRVINRTTQPIKEPSIRCVAFDANGKALGIANGFVHGYLTPTGPGFAEVIFIGEKGDARRFASAKCSIDDEPQAPPQVIEEKPQEPTSPRAGKDCSALPTEQRTLDCTIPLGAENNAPLAPKPDERAATSKERPARADELASLPEPPAGCRWVKENGWLLDCTHH